MAISGGDGSIILTTKVDTSGIKAGTTAIKTGFKGAATSATSFGVKVKSAIAGISTSLKSLFAMFIGIQTIFKAISFSGEAAQFATQTEASVQRLIDIYGKASQAVGDYIDANARALGMSKASASSFASVYGNLFSVWADQNTNAELTNRYLNMTAVVASKTGRTVQDVQERVRSGLLGNTEAIEDLGVFVNVKTIEMTDAFKRMADGRSWEQLDAYTQQQVRTMAILEQATAKYGNTVADTTATTRAQYQAAYEDFKNTWGQVLNTVLIPVLKVLTQVFTIATKGLQVLAGLSGKTVDNSKIQEKSIGGAVDNQKALTKAVKGTNKELKKSLAGFDELNILSQENASASSGTGTTGGANVSDLGIGDVGGNYDNSFVEKINTDLAAIMGYIGFALVAIGVLLICFGHIGWGIGFIIAGAAIFLVSQAALSEGAEAEKVKNIMNGIITGISLLALILGIILVATGGSLPLGIGLIIVGAAGLATEIALNWNAIKKAVTKFIDKNTGLIIGVAAALLVLGIILCLCGVITPLSIGLIVAGAGILAAEVTLNWEETKNTITKFFKDNAGLIVGISLAILVLGIILCCCGIITPLSIGMIVFGAGGLVATVALNWKAITTAISDFFKNNAGLVVGISLALLVLGIILLITGVGIPLGIGLVAAGAVGLVTIVALNWNAIKEKVTNVFNKVIDWVKTYGLLVIGILLCLTGAGIPLGIALIIKWAKDGAEKGVPLANVIVDKVKQVWNAVKQFWNTHIAKWFTKEHWAGLGKKMMNGLIGKIEEGLNKILTKFHNANIGQAIDFIAGGLGFDIPKSITIPRLARGAVIPPNREFLAVLGDQKRGTNIEAPLDTIKQAVAEVLSQSNAGSGYNGRIEVPVIIDGREIARAVRQAEGNMGSQTVFGGFANVY